MAGRAWWVGLVLLLAAGSSAAQSVTYGATGGVVLGGELDRLISGRTYIPAGGGVNVVDPVNATVLGKSTPMTLTRTLSGLNARTVMAIGLKSLPWVATGVVLWDYYDAVRVRPDGTGGLLQDDGVDPQTQPVDQFNCHQGGGSSTWFSSRQAACDALVDAMPRVQQYSAQCNSGAYVTMQAERSTGQGAAINATDTYMYLTTETTRVTTPWPPNCENQAASTVNNPQHFQSQGTVVNSESCPASIDPSNPAYSVPAGGAQVDGKCRTARYFHRAVSAAEAAAGAGSGIPANNLAPGVQDAINRGVDAAPYTSQPGALAGPASVTGSPTVSTTTPPSGSPTTTTQTPAAAVTYNNNTYNYTTTVTTTVTTGGETTTTEETLADDPDPVAECGVAGKPACLVKVDETGTPDGGGPSGPFADATAGANEARTGWLSSLGIENNSRDALPWSWSFDVPIGACTPFVWDTRLGVLTMDPCNSAGVSLWRALLGWGLAIATALYAWRSVNAAVAQG